MATDTATVAAELYEAGWSPLPLPPKQKKSPPAGYTGYDGRRPTAEDIESWTWDGNIALRLPPNVVGIDVDAYHGGELAPLEAKYGELPMTTWSTSRDDGSGIALFQVPTGTTLNANPAPGIEAIQSHHRYMVVWPSIHPEGRRYQWIDEQSGEVVDYPPSPEELPHLPWSWIEGLTVVKAGAAASATPDQARAFIDANNNNLQPGSLNGVRTRLANSTGSRHDTLVTVACWALREAAAGMYPAQAAIDVMHSWWMQVMDDRERRDGGEFGACILWAVAQVEADPDRVAEIVADNNLDSLIASPRIDTSTGEIILPPPDTKPASPKHLPNDFWSARPELGHIRQAAHAQLTAADSTLLVVLARAVTLVPPAVTLPAIVGGRVSLNVFGSIVDPSGGGKTASVAVGRQLVPIIREDIVDPIMPSSGEGLIEAFMGWKDVTDSEGRTVKERHQVKLGGFAFVDEGQGLLAQSERSGSTIMETIRSAWMGGDLGQHNASEDRRRWLKEHQYRLCMIIGFQLAYAAHLIGDGEGGTPQRFTFTLGTDPAVDADQTHPGQLTLERWPITTPNDIDVADSIRRGVRERRLQRSRGEVIVDPLDTHADLRKLKLAAALGVLAGRLSITEEDWQLANVIDDTSCAVRSAAIETDRHRRQAEHATAIRLSAERAAAITDVAVRKATEAAARGISRAVWRHGPMAPSKAMEYVSSRYRGECDVDDAVSISVERKWLTINADNVARGAVDPR